MSTSSEPGNPKKEHDPYAWRHPQPMQPLSSFDYPIARRRGHYNERDVSSFSTHRMCGWDPQLTPLQIRDALRKSKPSKDELAYLREMIIQLDSVDFGNFVRSSGASIYEIANIMSQFEITSPILMHYINFYSLDYQPSKVNLPKYIFSGSMYHPYGVWN